MEVEGTGAPNTGGRMPPPALKVVVVDGVVVRSVGGGPDEDRARARGCVSILAGPRVAGWGVALRLTPRTAVAAPPREPHSKGVERRKSVDDDFATTKIGGGLLAPAFGTDPGLFEFEFETNQTDATPHHASLAPAAALVTVTTRSRDAPALDARLELDATVRLGAAFPPREPRGEGRFE